MAVRKFPLSGLSGCNTDLACKGDDAGHTQAFEALLQAGVRIDAPTAEGQSCATFFLQNKATRKLVKAARKAAKSDL